MQKTLVVIFVFLLNVSFSKTGFSQDKFFINLAALSGQKINKSNLHAFSILNNTNRVEQLIVRGTIKMRSSRSTVNYQYQVSLKPGTNDMKSLARGVAYTYSSTSLEKLFRQHGLLPNGEFEYCVDLFEPGGEGLDALASDCIYDENQDLFLINLMEPEDKAKIDELYPMFSWSVNSSLINELNYKLRVAEIKDGQRPNNAIMRNRPVYEQSGLRFPTQNYPVTARSLEYWQPYAWTVDAYYKDILMGSAETWQFVIINDSLMQGVPREASYLDIRKEKGKSSIYAIGQLKLKYVLKELRTDALKLKLYRDGKLQKLKQKELSALHGDNRYEIEFYKQNRLRHLKMYKLILSNTQGEKFEINFRYVNPDFF